jgi:hypothetical protein
VYSAAYIMPSPPFGAARKHSNHLRLVEHMMRDSAPQKVAAATTMASVFSLLRGYPSLGDFLAFQLAIDLNYSTVTNFSEMDFVVAGPGARDGIRKCFADVDGFNDGDVIRAVADMADAEFFRFGVFRCVGENANQTALRGHTASAPSVVPAEVEGVSFQRTRRSRASHRFAVTYRF